MRFIKRIILPIIALLFVIQMPISVYCQVGVRGTTKSSSKNTTKGADKTETKATTKQVAKSDNSSAKIAKNEAKLLTKKAIKEEVRKSTEKGTSKTAQEAIEALLKRESRKIASESLVTTTVVKKAEKKGENVVGKRGLKTTTKSSTTKTIIKASTQESKAIMNSAVKAEINSISKASGEKVAQRISTNEISMNIATESVEKALNKTAAKRWESLVKADSHTTGILLKDLDANPQLARQFKLTPALLDAYHRNIGSPTYRTDLNILRYQTNGANKYSDVLKYSGNDLKIVEETGINYIIDVNSNEVLGTISGTTENWIINTTGSENKLYDLYPLGNTTYVHDNGYAKTIRKTDGQGFVKECTTQFYKNIPPTVTKDRDKVKIGIIKEIKNDYNVIGTKSSKNHNLNDKGCHIVPPAMGGSDNAINIFPQNSKMNRSGVWNKSERAAKKARNDGKYVERTVYFTKDKDDKGSLRPSSVHLIQKINGEVTVDEIIDNPKVIKR